MRDEQSIESPSGIAYRRAGNGPVVVLLHGIPGSASSWQQVAAELPATLDVIVPDLLGFGASKRPRSLDDLHAPAQATALADLPLSLATLPLIGPMARRALFSGPSLRMMLRQRRRPRKAPARPSNPSQRPHDVTADIMALTERASHG